MKFSNYLQKSVENDQVSFYTIYTYDFPSKKFKEMKPGKEKDKAFQDEQNKYNKLLGDFLRITSSMN